jgi:hypothetical protein
MQLLGLCPVPLRSPAARTTIGDVTDEGAARKKLGEGLGYSVRDLPSQGRLTEAARKIKRWVGDLLFERDIETSARQVELDHFHRERTYYGASDWLDLPRVLRKCELGPADVLVDFGSGKGRVLYQAAHHPFARVIGLEISAKLNEVARENIERKRHELRCQNIELVTADAATFVIPDDMTFAYFYHPFSDQTFDTVIENIVESLDRNPRRVTIIYQCPLMEDSIMRTGRFELVRTLKGRRNNPRRIAVYVHEPG